MNHAYAMYFVPGAWAMVDGTEYAVHDFSACHMALGTSTHPGPGFGGTASRESIV